VSIGLKQGADVRGRGKSQSQSRTSDPGYRVTFQGLWLSLGLLALRLSVMVRVRAWILAVPS